MARKAAPALSATKKPADKAASSAAQAPASGASGSSSEARSDSATGSAVVAAPEAPTAPPAVSVTKTGAAPAARAKAPTARATAGKAPAKPNERGGASEDDRGVALDAEAIVAGNLTTHVLALGMQLSDERPTVAAQAARVLEEILARKPEMLVPVVDRLVPAVLGHNAKVIALGAAALPHVARLAPARVAKHLGSLTDGFASAGPTAQDGLLRTFAALCHASVAYQKRLEPVIDRALGEAEPKVLPRWVEIALPALKGEPHARARAVVEQRLGTLPRPIALKVADYLGVKLRRLSP
jgi:hypothetical protein